MKAVNLSYYCISLLLFFLTHSPVFAQSAYVIFEDNFDDNRNGWLLGDRGKTLAKIDSGSFYLESKNSRTGYPRWLPVGYFYKNQDFQITIKLKQVKGNLLRGFALQWGGDPIENRFHEIWLRRDGKVSVSTLDKLVADKPVDHLPFSYTPTISTTGYNVVRMEKKGELITYFINDQEVFKLPYTGIFDAYLGFICPAAGAIRVDYIQVALLNQSPHSIFSQEATPNIYAVNVGIGTYKNSDTWKGFSDLKFTRNDARAMHNFFLNENAGAVPVQNLSLLLDEQATKSRIIAELKHQVSKAWNNDLIIFFFAGHGIKGKEEDDNSLYLLPHDYEIGNPETAIHYKELEEIFESVPSKNKLIIMDACHSGGSLPTLEGDWANILGSLKDKEIAILTSSQLGETSLEATDIERGLYSHYLTRGLTFDARKADTNQDNVVTILELHIYVSTQTAAAARKKSHIQTPQLGGKFSVRLPLATIRTK
ncbi:MAG: hypothetical protein Roseis2KO_42630 [Roseivirga sp.]